MTEEKERLDEEIEEEPGEPERPPRRKRRRRVPRWARLAISLFVLIILLLFITAAVLEIINDDRIFNGVQIDGEPVGGMSLFQALKVVSDNVKPYEQNLTLTFEDRQFTIAPKEISFHVQSAATVTAAYLKGRQDTLPVRMFKRVFGIHKNINVPIVFTYNEGKLKKRLTDIAKEINREPTSVRISVASGSPEIIPSRKGATLLVDKSQAAVAGALTKKERTVGLVVDYKKPELTEEDVGKIVLIRLSEFRLYLYDKEEFVDDYEIAVGMPAYPTPTGRFHITYKEKNPTWLPTSEWAKDKQGIPQPPGPDNPLGGYWMDLGSGLGIHATPYVGSLGEQASHGCIRMAPEDAEKLFNAVNVGTPVFIVP